MCGRYAASRSAAELVEEFEVEQDLTGTAKGGPAVEPDFNLAPTKPAPVVMERSPVTGDGPVSIAAPGDDPGSDDPGDDGTGDEGPGDEPNDDDDSSGRTVRQLRTLTWGLVPSWSKDASGAARLINARAETLLTKNAFRRAALMRRALVPADGWYEWQRPAGGGSGPKQPWFFAAPDGGPLAFAGLYEFWRRPGGDPEDPESWLTTFSIVTTAAVGPPARVHDRMPLALPADAWAEWLDPTPQDADGVAALLALGGRVELDAHPVGTAVNQVANQGPSLILPATDEQLVLDSRGEPAGGDILF